jgi:hypothetical protein
MDEKERIEHEKDAQKVLDILNGLTTEYARNVLRIAINKLEAVSIVTIDINES